MLVTVFHVFSRSGTYVGTLDRVTRALLERSVDGTDTLDITMYGSVQRDERIVFVDELGLAREYVVDSVREERADGVPVCQVFASGSKAELAHSVIEDKRNRNATARQCLAKALEGTRWTVGTVEGQGYHDVAFYHTNVLQAVQDICDAFSLECVQSVTLSADATQVTGRVISLVLRSGVDTAKRFEYGLDLTSVSRKVETAGLATRVYAYGKGLPSTGEDGEATGGYGRKISFADVNGGKAYVEDVSATRRFGIPNGSGGFLSLDTVADFPDCEDKQELLALARERLAQVSTPVVSYTATVAALGAAGFDTDRVQVGDSVTIVDTTFSPELRVQGRVLAVKQDLTLDGQDCEITLGNISSSLTQVNAAVEQSLKRLTGSAGAWDNAASLGTDYLNGIVAGLNSVLNETGGYVYFVQGEGLYIYDKPRDGNPTSCIHLGGGYWRIANSKTSQGQWAWRTLATGRGLVADALYTGTIRGGSNTWDLTSGDLYFRQGQIVIDGPDGTQTRIDSAHGLQIWQRGAYIGGLDIVDGKAYLRAARAGASQTLYMTTGKTSAGNPGMTLHNKNGDYAEIEALHAVDDKTDATSGVGLSALGKPFAEASTYYNHVYVHPPMKQDTYMEHPDEQLFIRSSGNKVGSKRSAQLQLSDSRGLFMNDNQIILKFDDTHYVRVDGDGVQIRCGTHGFGWLNGEFVDSLVWN